VIHGYLSGLSRPEQVMYFFRDVVGEAAVSKESAVAPYQRVSGMGGSVCRHHCPIEWAGAGVRKEDYVRPALPRMERENRHGV
jgi:hypothetical protein